MKIFSTSDPSVIKKLTDAGINPTNVVNTTSDQSMNFYEHEEDDMRIGDALKDPVVADQEPEEKKEKKSTIKEKIKKFAKGKKNKK